MSFISANVLGCPIANCNMHACMHACPFLHLTTSRPLFERFTQAFIVWPTSRSWLNRNAIPKSPNPNHFEHLLVVVWRFAETFVRQERHIAQGVEAIVAGRRPLLVSVLRHAVICKLLAGGRRGCRLSHRLPYLFLCVRELAITSLLLLGFGITHGGRRWGLLWAGVARA